MTPLLRGQTRIVLRYSLFSAMTLYDRALAHLLLWYSLFCAEALFDRASAHLVFQYSLLSATTLSVSASTLLLCATAPQYCTVPLGTYCVVSYSFLITDLGSQTVI